MDHKWLEDFIALAREKSFSKTTELPLAPPMRLRTTPLPFTLERLSSTKSAVFGYLEAIICYIFNSKLFNKYRGEMPFSMIFLHLKHEIT